jgi:hypothetical protein
MGAKKHVHQYHKVQIAAGKVWACALCNHFMPVHLENLIPNRYSICWSCGDHFRLGPQNMALDKPECDDCLGIIDEAIPKSIAERLKGL